MSSELIKKIIAGAVSGFVAAVVVDINAWSKSDKPYDWGLAFKRWVSGAVSGAVAGLGTGGVA